MRDRMWPQSGLRRWIVLWVLFSLLGGLWALASPLFGVPDEPAHAVYSAGAIRGDVWEEGEKHNIPVEVPAEFGKAGQIAGCFAFRPEIPAGCGGAFADEPGTIELATSAGRYPPVYYLYAGIGSLVTGGATAVYLMRALTAVAVGALLASAACSVLDQRRRTWSLLGLGLSMTPMLFFFAGAINPQAPEIAAAILLWVSGAALLDTARRRPGTSLRLSSPPLRRVVVAVVTLALARPLSLLWIALIVVALLVALATRASLRELLRSTAVRVGGGIALLAGGFTFFWVLARDSLIQQDVPIYADTSLGAAVLISTSKLDNEYQEMIGVFGWRDTNAPGLVYVVFTLLLGALVYVAATRAPARALWTVAGVAALVVVLPPVLELREYQSSAFAWQGRYTLPLAVGVPLLLGFLADSRDSVVERPVVPPPARRFLRVPVLFAAGLLLVHVVSFVGALNRNVHGVVGFWFVSETGWTPPLPPFVLIALHLATCVALAVLLVRALDADEAPAEESGEGELPLTGRATVPEDAVDVVRGAGPDTAPAGQRQSSARE